jgi:hypothetical protein
MKKFNLSILALFFMSMLIISCGAKKENADSSTPKEEKTSEEKTSSSNEETDEAEEDEASTDTEESKSSDASPADEKEAIHYETYNYTKSFKEEELEKGPSHALDFRKRKNDKFIGIKFADGHSGTLVYRDGFFYNYTIREKTEVRFASKEDGLQRIWDDSRLLKDAGAAIASFSMRKSGPRKKDGTPDMRYKANQ